MPSLRRAPALGAVGVVALTIALTPLVAAARTPARPAGGGTGAGGAASTDAAQVFQQDCAICHGSSGEGSFRGPAIDRAGTAAVDFMLTTGRMPIDHPQQTISRDRPAYTREEIGALVAYTHSFMKAGPEVPAVDVAGADLAEGGEQYRLNCASCHQAAGKGGALAYGVNAPPLTSSDATQVVEAMRTGPGRMPVFGPERFDDRTASAIAAYVQYLRDPSDRGGASLGRLGPVPEGLVAWTLGFGAVLVLVRWLGTRDPIDEEGAEL